MLPSQPQSRFPSLNQKSVAANTRILLKDGIKSLGVNPVGRKKTATSFISLDGIQRKEVMNAALRLQNEEISRFGSGIQSNLVDKHGAGEQDSGTGYEELDEVIGMQQDANSGNSGNEYEFQADAVGNRGAGEQNFESGNVNNSSLVGEVEPAKETFACANILESTTVGEGACGANLISKVVGDGEYFKQTIGSGAGKQSTLVGSLGLNYSKVGKLPDSGNKVDGNKSNKPWTEILKPKKAIQRMKFEYHMPDFEDGKVVIKPPLNVDIQGREPWLNCLVGYFFEKRVAFHTMEYHANRRWINRGLTDVIMNEDGFFFFKFNCEEDLLEVLEEDVCLVEGKPLILQRWYHNIVLSKDVPKTIPLWMKIFNIPLQYWNCKGLSRIGSGVGNILMVDALTEKMCREASGRLSFAKLLIEVDASKPLEDILYVHILDDDFMEPVERMLRVEYPWRPSWCPTCRLFGHGERICPVVCAAQEKKNKEVQDSQIGGTGNGDFIKVQKKGKDKVENMGFKTGKFYPGPSSQGNQFVVNNKRKIINFLYVNKGKVDNGCYAIFSVASIIS